MKKYLYSIYVNKNNVYLISDECFIMRAQQFNREIFD